MATPEFEPEMIPVAPAAREYLEALHENGLLQGEREQAALDEQVEDVLRALHVVLAGGRVNIDIGEPGASSVSGDLDAKLDAALDQTRGFAAEVALFF